MIYFDLTLKHVLTLLWHTYVCNEFLARWDNRGRYANYVKIKQLWFTMIEENKRI